MPAPEISAPATADTTTAAPEIAAPEGTERLTAEAPGTAPHDAPVAAQLVEFMARRWAPAQPSPTRAAAAAPFHAQRRDLLSARFPGDWIVVPTGHPKVRANDTDYRFRPGTDFAWLTGHHGPGAVLVLAPQTEAGHAATLYTTPRSDRSTPGFFTDRVNGELWVGPRPGLEEISAALCIEAAPIDDLAGALKAAESSVVRMVRGFDADLDAEIAVTTPETDDDLLAVLAELRLVKDDHEISCLQAAVDATMLGFEDVVRALPEAGRHSERWVEGTFNRRARTEGNDVGYDTIAACGHHACTLHWIRNDGPVRPGDLLLLDAGVEGPELYTADVTRTLPVSGHFSPAQREVYDTVWRAQQAGIAECRPGNDFRAPHRAAVRVVTEWLVAKGILTTTVDEALDEAHPWHVRYTLHGVSHMLGLDVHDCANTRDGYRDHELRPGMVLTVEPGCYLQPDDLTVPEEFRGIGVRIEDDVVITADGAQVLSAALPSEASALEAWMAPLLAAGNP
ncbi:MAG: aminopeptidase P family protein [Acidimicrobiales bacterium]